MDTGREEPPVPSAGGAPAELPPTGTHEVALVPRGLVVAVPALGTEGAAVAGAADAEAGAAAGAVAIASPVAAAGLPGPAGTGCTGRDQPAGSRAGRQRGPSSPTSTPLIPRLLTPAVRAVGAGRAAKHQPVHTQPLEKVGVLLAPGEGEIQHSAPCHSSVHPAIIPLSLSPELTHGTTTAPRAPRSAPAVGGRRSLRGHRHPPAPPADGSHCGDMGQGGV